MQFDPKRTLQGAEHALEEGALDEAQKHLDEFLVLWLDNTTEQPQRDLYDRLNRRLNKALKLQTT